MSDHTPQRFSAPVRRGFAHILAYLEEDINVPLTHLQHPLLRRLKANPQADVLAALRYMAQSANDQARWETAKKEARTQK